MCGIFGAISLGGSPIDVYSIKLMSKVIAHRGYDDYGFFASNMQGDQHTENIDQAYRNSNMWDIFLGHRRLSVIDLTTKGHQPMCDASKNIWITYNGEVYNFIEIKNELKKLNYTFKSKTDTEVLLNAYKEWGMEAIHKFNGMFALAIWDANKKILFLVRDRYGTKPLYYTISNNTLIFSSEIKSILKYKNVDKSLSYCALNEYFTFQNLFRNETLFKNINTLPQASYLKVYNNTITIKEYWDFNFQNTNHTLSFNDCKDKLLDLFTQAVKRQLVSDVPVGGCLSGGMDSGSIVALASQYLPRMMTFTGGFDLSQITGVEANIDERKDAELISNQYKTQHYEQIINAGDIRWIMPKLIRHLEDLRVGMSYPDYYISNLASKFVKVCLSGAGGDELFAGYPWRYYSTIKSLNKDSFLQNYYNFWQRLVSHEDKNLLFQNDVFEQIKDDNPFDIFKSIFNKNSNLKYNSSEDYINNSLYFEIKTYLPGLLIVGDKLSMANNLEVRFPFLDNDLVNFAMQIPIEYKLNNFSNIKKVDENILKRSIKYDESYNNGKSILRETMQKLLPTAITNKKKQGFVPPDASWYRGENFDYVKEILLDTDVKSSKYIRKDYINEIINKHSKGENFRLLIWSLLCFEFWCKEFNI